jgi:hypothetical protein
MRNLLRVYSKIIERTNTTWGSIVAADMLVFQHNPETMQKFFSGKS